MIQRQKILKAEGKRIKHSINKTPSEVTQAKVREEDADFNTIQGMLPSPI